MENYILLFFKYSLNDPYLWKRKVKLKYLSVHKEININLFTYHPINISSIF